MIPELLLGKDKKTNCWVFLLQTPFKLTLLCSQSNQSASNFSFPRKVHTSFRAITHPSHITIRVYHIFDGIVLSASVIAGGRNFPTSFWCFFENDGNCCLLPPSSISISLSVSRSLFFSNSRSRRNKTFFIIHFTSWTVRRLPLTLLNYLLFYAVTPQDATRFARLPTTDSRCM